MKSLSRRATCFALFCLVGIGWASAAEPVKPNYPVAEYDRATLILMHTPTGELFDGVIHPAAALFEDYFDPEMATNEHLGYIKKLKERGAKVVTVRELLNTAPIATLQQLASEALIYESKNGAMESASMEQYRAQIIQRMGRNVLIETILSRPIVEIDTTMSNTKLKAKYVHRAMMNLFFMRDPMITTQKGVVIGRMHSSQRAPECDIIEVCLSQLGIKAIHRLSNAGAFLEGGDYLPLTRNTAMLGMGMRTTQQAVDELLQNDLIGADTLVVVKDNLHWQAQMHLDTYFNIIDSDLVTLCSNRLGAKPTDKEFVRVDIYSRKASNEPYVKCVESQPFTEFLKSRNLSVIAIGGEDETHHANNFLCIGPRHIAAVAGQSKQFEETLKSYNVTVDWIDLENLIKGYGAAHCMTQVLEREPIFDVKK